MSVSKKSCLVAAKNPSKMLQINVSWTLIVLPVITIIIVLIVLLCILKHRNNQFDVHQTQDGHSYRILDV